MKYKNNIVAQGSVIFEAYSASEITAYTATNPPIGTTISDGTRNLRYNGVAFVPFYENPFVRLETDGNAANLINRNVTTLEAVQWDTTTVFSNDSIPADFTYTGGTGLTTQFTGAVEVSYIMPLTTTGARVHIESSITRRRVGQVDTDQFMYTYTYMRAANGHFSDTNAASMTIDCLPGDTFRLAYTREGTTATATNIVHTASMCLTRK